MQTIGIDASSANKIQKTGVEWYAYHLIQNLKKHALNEDERVFLYAPGPLAHGLEILPPGWQEQVLPWPLARGWMQGRMSLEMRRRKPDLLFVPAQSLPRILGTKTATTIHDLGFRYRPDLYAPRQRLSLELSTRDAVSRADLILTVSEATRQDLLKTYSLPPKRVAAVPLAADFGVFKTYPVVASAAAGERFGIEHPYFLFVGRLEAKKNIVTLIQAFDRLMAEGDGVFNLVLAGVPGFGREQIEQAIAKSQNQKLIKRIGYAPAPTVALLLNSAAAFCFPSWFEGFGLPNLEAMAAGAPLIVSDIPAHREVVGNAGLFARPDDPDAWAKAMQRIVDNPNLAHELAQRGRERARDYSWSRTAARTWEIFRNLL